MNPLRRLATAAVVTVFRARARLGGFVLLLVLLPAQLTHADIIVTGSNLPANPGDWGSGTTVYIGVNGDPGTLAVTDGSSLGVSNLLVGSFGEGSLGTVTVSGGSVTTSGGFGVVVGNGGTSSLLVNNGGSVSSPAATIGWNTPDSSVTVTGTGSQWVNSGNVSLGNSEFDGNTLAIADGGLVKVGGTLDFFRNGSLNFLRLDGGYLALFGNQLSTAGSYITGGEVQTWSGTDWVVNTDLGAFSLAYYATDAAAESFTGYGGLGGYTILAVPEPSTYAMALAGLACSGFSMWRRRKRA